MLKKIILFYGSSYSSRRVATRKLQVTQKSALNPGEIGMEDGGAAKRNFNFEFAAGSPNLLIGNYFVRRS